jgi:hypothetical protein
MNSLEEIFRAIGGLTSREVAAIGPWPFFLVLLLSLGCAFFVAFLYKHFYSNRETGTQMHRAFPLLGLSITAIFICIQFSLPLSLGLLGALSIVRFRTPVKEPEEIGFLMVVIATSLACATFNFLFLVVILGLALGAVLVQEFVFTRLGSSGRQGLVMVMVPAAEYEARRGELRQALTETLPRGRFESLSRQEDRVVVAYSFWGLRSPALGEVEEKLAAAVPAGQISVSFKTAGGL